MSLFFFLAVASAHLCMLSPTQRLGPVNVNVEATPGCGLAPVFGFSGPCGHNSAKAPLVQIGTGVNFTVVFQKNEDHFCQPAPGYFEIAVIVDGARTKLMVVPDTPTPWSYVYQVVVVVPRTLANSLAAFQTLYFTNNPAVKNTTFYQCADVLLV